VSNDNVSRNDEDRLLEARACGFPTRLFVFYQIRCVIQLSGAGSRNESGSEFQTAQPATGKARVPKVLQRNREYSVCDRHSTVTMGSLQYHRL